MLPLSRSDGVIEHVCIPEQEGGHQGIEHQEYSDDGCLTQEVDLHDHSNAEYDCQTHVSYVGGVLTQQWVPCTWYCWLTGRALCVLAVCVTAWNLGKMVRVIFIDGLQ